MYTADVYYTQRPDNRSQGKVYSWNLTLVFIQGLWHADLLSQHAATKSLCLVRIVLGMACAASVLCMLTMRSSTQHAV